MRRKMFNVFILSVVLALSPILLGVAGAASLVTMQKNGMELVQLRQAAEMYGYSVAWDGKERSITLTYTGMMMNDMKDDMMMDDMKDNMMMDDMKDDMMMDDMKDDMMMNDMEDDMMNDMKDNKMMNDMMKVVGQTITLWVDLERVTVDGKLDSLDSAPAIYENTTYVTHAFVEKYLKNSSMMK